MGNSKGASGVIAQVNQLHVIWVILSKRISFIYIEHAKISCKQKALVADTHDGIFTIPCGSLMTLLLGPGTSITHDAMSLMKIARKSPDFNPGMDRVDL